MLITMDFSPADIMLIQKHAEASNLSMEDFTRDTVMKAVRNAEYLAKIDRAYKNLEEGKGKTFTDEEWERFVHEQELR